MHEAEAARRWRQHSDGGALSAVSVLAAVDVHAPIAPFCGIYRPETIGKRPVETRLTRRLEECRKIARGRIAFTCGVIGSIGSTRAVGNGAAYKCGVGDCSAEAADDLPIAELVLDHGLARLMLLGF